MGRGIGMALGIGFLWACAADPGPERWEAPKEAAREKSPVKADAESIDRGQKLFAQSCARCHGQGGVLPASRREQAKAKGSTLPLDMNDPVVAQQSDGALFWKITEGKPQRPKMPGFKKLPAEQRWDLVNYLRSVCGAGKDAEKKEAGKKEIEKKDEGKKPEGPH